VSDSTDVDTLVVVMVAKTVDVLLCTLMHSLRVVVAVAVCVTLIVEVKVDALAVTVTKGVLVTFRYARSRTVSVWVVEMMLAGGFEVNSVLQISSVWVEAVQSAARSSARSGGRSLEKCIET